MDEAQRARWVGLTYMHREALAAARAAATALGGRKGSRRTRQNASDEALKRLEEARAAAAAFAHELLGAHEPHSATYAALWAAYDTAPAEVDTPEDTHGETAFSLTPEAEDAYDAFNAVSTALAPEALPVAPGAKVVIECEGRRYVALVQSAAHHGPRDGWYVEFTHVDTRGLEGSPGYWKQGRDGEGGTIAMVPSTQVH